MINILYVVILLGILVSVYRMHELENNILYWVMLLGVLLLLLISKRLNPKTPRTNSVAGKVIATNTKERFPTWYRLRRLIRGVVLIGCGIALFALCWFLVTHYSQWLLSGKEYIALSTNAHAMVSLVLAFFLGLVWGSFLLSPLDRIFSSAAYRLKKNHSKGGNGKTRGNSKSFTKSYRTFTIIFSFLTASLLFLVADNYYYVDQQALHYNSFFGISEKSIPLGKLEKIEVAARKGSSRRFLSGSYWEYVLVFSTGEKFNLREAGATDLKELDTLLMGKNIPVEVTRLDDNARVWVTSNAWPDVQELFKQVLSRSR